MKNARLLTRCLLTAILLCTIAGCYTRTQSGDKVEFAFAGWVGVAVILGGLLSVPAGWFVRRWKAGWGWALLVLGPILLLLVGPAMYSDRVLIDRDHFEARYGFWFRPTTHSIRFADLREIRYVGVPARRGRVNYQLHCINKNGGTEVVSAGDLVRNAVPEILTQAAAQGVPVFSERQ